MCVYVCVCDRAAQTRVRRTLGGGRGDVKSRETLGCAVSVDGIKGTGCWRERGQRARCMGNGVTA